MALPSGPLYRWRAGSLGLANGAQVSSWADEGSAGKTLTQVTSSARPLFVTSGIGGQPAVNFDGVDDSMVTAASATRPAVATLLLVVDPNATGAGQPFHTVGMEFYWDTGVYGIYQFASVGLSTDLSRAAAVHTGVFTGTTSAELYANGSLVATGNAGSSSLSTTETVTIGNHGSQPRPFPGLIAEVLLYDRVLTTGERAAAHSYVQDTYGISVADYVASSPPAAPTGLAVTSVTTATASLSWTASSGATSYEVVIVENP